MNTENDIDDDNRIVQINVTGEITTGQASKLVQNISIAVKLNQGYNVLVDIRNATFNPEMVDLFEISSEFSKQLVGFNRKIALLIPNTEKLKQVAKLLRICMEAKGFQFKQFFDYDATVKWL
jgi:hypothetical protein